MATRNNGNREESKIRFMNRLVMVAGIEGIVRSELLLDEADYFYDRHHDHGYDLIISMGDEGLESISLECTRLRLGDPKKECPEGDYAELSYSLIYSRREVSEIEVQRERRQEEGYS